MKSNQHNGPKEPKEIPDPEKVPEIEPNMPDENPVDPDKTPEVPNEPPFLNPEVDPIKEPEIPLL